MVELGLAESREKAQRLALAGQVKVDGQPATKPGHRYPRGASIDVETPPRFVGRGGEKLEHALAGFGIDVAGRICLDVGASTGGFTDCLLQRRAARVYALDVGAGLIHWRLRNDARVVLLENVNARNMSEGLIPEPVEVVTVDVSFISLTLVLPAVIKAAAAGAHIVTLVKPQFEAGREQVERGGVVRDEAIRAAVLDRISTFGVSELGLEWLGVLESPIRGRAGNVEYLAHWRFPG